ncbi:unnamed protein product [Parascedosporium putredinis]|uniref:Uncharacterized protein n=1 Tax=Parascedosporium putredinis TaxID=1442378 RepID=A0A9P1MFH1_9PEZI|nr:unnamed protein product [Parascedosporium putredinis]CAI8002364.1 unnamed protein product [Parascedosporium putredinis]
MMRKLKDLGCEDLAEYENEGDDEEDDTYITRETEKTVTDAILGLLLRIEALERTEQETCNALQDVLAYLETVEKDTEKICNPRTKLQFLCNKILRKPEPPQNNDDDEHKLAM